MDITSRRDRGINLKMGRGWGGGKEEPMQAKRKGRSDNYHKTDLSVGGGRGSQKKTLEREKEREEGQQPGEKKGRWSRRPQVVEPKYTK